MAREIQSANAPRFVCSPSSEVSLHPGKENLGAFHSNLWYFPEKAKYNEQGSLPRSPVNTRLPSKYLPGGKCFHPPKEDCRTLNKRLLLHPDCLIKYVSILLEEKRSTFKCHYSCFHNAVWPEWSAAGIISAFIQDNLFIYQPKVFFIDLQ